MDSTVRGAMWTQAVYNPNNLKGQPLPHEKDRLAFKKPWDRIEKRVYSASPQRPPRSVPIALDWLEYPVEWLCEESSIASENELRSCHSFVTEIKRIFEISKSIKWRNDNGLLEFARDLCLETKNDDRNRVIEKLEQRFSANSEGTSFGTRQCPLPYGSSVEEYAKSLAPHIRAAAKYRTFVPEKAQRDYFNIAQAIKESHVFGTRFPLRNPPAVRAHVLDLLSIRDDRYKLMVVRKYLQDERENAVTLYEKVRANQEQKGATDKRNPLFIVVDEAHNLLPSEPETRAAKDVRDQFRWIAGEGRKFGVYLILVTQEPAKLDPRVTSLCVNRAIMKMSGGDVLKGATKSLGLTSKEATEARIAPELRQGRVLLFGPWAQGPCRLFYGGMRRTPPGGSDLP
jgi:hypothetical protein